jgi:hypothetical protein
VWCEIKRVNTTTILKKGFPHFSSFSYFSFALVEFLLFCFFLFTKDTEGE